MKTKGAQFWILLIAACVISALQISQIFISRSIIQKQRSLIDLEKTAQAAPYYKQAWQDLAVQVWRGGAEDPALIDLLKSEGIGIHQGLPPGAAPAGTNAAPAAPSVESTPVPGTLLAPPPGTP